MKFFTLFIVASAFVDSAFSLNCYATDLNNLISNRKVAHSSQNCDNYVRAMMSKFGLGELPPGQIIPNLVCYTANVSTKGGSLDFVVKGCAPRSYCQKNIKKLIEDQAEARSVRVTGVRCDECTQNNCNGDRNNNYQSNYNNYRYNGY